MTNAKDAKCVNDRKIAMTGWKAIEGTSKVGKDYGNEATATVQTEPEDWYGRQVYRWEVCHKMYGGRLDGTNYLIGNCHHGGIADSMEDAMAECDKFAG